MAGASAAQPVPAAPVTAVAAGCERLLYPEGFAGVVAALDRAVGGAISAARADEALGHYDETLAAWGDLPDQGEPDLAAHGAFADGLADRAAHLVRGDAPIIRAPLAVSIVDDDDRHGERRARSEEHTSELQSRLHLVCRLLLEKKKKNATAAIRTA